MNIGIIVHSQTGHTLSVANMLRERFLVAGHKAVVERVSASDDRETNVNSIFLTSSPKPDGYDMIVIGAPVRGYTLSPVMQAYLNQSPSLNGKIIEGFVTQFFRPTMGGNQAISRLSEICTSKGAILAESGIIKWSNPFSRKKAISVAIDKITGIKV